MADAIDHLVIAVADPDRAADELARSVGIECTGGGRHADGGTRNRIAFLGDAYLELVGVDDPASAAARPFGRAVLHVVRQGAGLATYALLDEAIEATVATLRANDSSIGPVTAGARERPDGERVEWWSAMPPELGPGHPPFLIKHRDDGAEWGTESLTARAEFVHPIGSTVRLVRLDIAAGDPPTLAAEYQRTIALELWSVGDLAVGTVGPHTIRLLPVREMPVPAVVTVAASVDEPRTVEALGMRFDIEPTTG